jgi:hypothetical protein
MELDSIFKRLNPKAGAAGAKGQFIQPPLLVSPVRFPYGPFRFTAQLPKGLPYVIQASTDLKTWMPVFDHTSPGVVEYLDSKASRYSSRFYRMDVNGTLSVNVVGYVTITLAPGFAMIANPLEAPDSSVAELFKVMPDGTTVSKFDPQTSRLSENTRNQGKWLNPGEKLVPGEGAIIFNPTLDYKSLHFAGNVRQGGYSIPIPAGFSMRSSPKPLSGRLDSDLHFPIADGDVIHLFDRDRQKYVLHPFSATEWSSNPPVVGVGESFWVAKQSAKNWIGYSSGAVNPPAAGDNRPSATT